MHYRHLMLFFYWKDKNTTQAASKICAVYSDGAIAERIVEVDFNLEDQEHPGRPFTTDED